MPPQSKTDPACSSHATLPQLRVQGSRPRRGGGPCSAARRQPCVAHTPCSSCPGTSTRAVTAPCSTSQSQLQTPRAPPGEAQVTVLATPGGSRPRTPSLASARVGQDAHRDGSLRRDLVANGYRSSDALPNEPVQLSLQRSHSHILDGPHLPVHHIRLPCLQNWSTTGKTSVGHVLLRIDRRHLSVRYRLVDGSITDRHLSVGPHGSVDINRFMSAGSSASVARQWSPTSIKSDQWVNRFADIDPSMSLGRSLGGSVDAPHFRRAAP